MRKIYKGSRKNANKTEPETEDEKLQNSVEEEKKPEWLPGSASVYVKTYGCSHNISDSEYMAGLLQDYGFKLVDTMAEADACLLNSCTVKNPSQEKFINLVGSAEKQGKPVIVSGCVP